MSTGSVLFYDYGLLRLRSTGVNASSRLAHSRLHWEREYLDCLSPFGFVFTSPRESSGNLGGMVQRAVQALSLFN